MVTEYSSRNDDLSKLRRTKAEAVTPSQPVEQGHKGVRLRALEVRAVRHRELRSIPDRGQVSRRRVSGPLKPWGYDVRLSPKLHLRAGQPDLLSEEWLDPEEALSNRSLFVTQRDDGIYADGSPCGEVAGQQHNQGQQA